MFCNFRVVFFLQVHFHANKTYFHAIVFARGLEKREAQANSQIANFPMKLRIATDETVS